MRKFNPLIRLIQFLRQASAPQTSAWSESPNRELILLIALATMMLLVSAASFAQTTGSVPDSSFVYIPANTAFTYTDNVSNTTTGGAAPIDSAYVMAKTHVTNAQYKAFIIATGHQAPSYWTNGSYPGGKGDHPVLFVSLTDAQAYCAWLNTRYTGYQFRVPTSPEWENAAKGPNKYTWPWGNTEGTTYANGVLTSKYTYDGVASAWYLANRPTERAIYNNSSSTMYNQSQPIDSIISISSTGYVTNWINHTNYTGFVYTNVFDSLNAQGGFTASVYTHPEGRSYYGLYDMAGNAYEWTSTIDTGQTGIEAGQLLNAVRGASWYAVGVSCKTSYRGEVRNATGKYNTVGFRVAATAKVASSATGIAGIAAAGASVGALCPNPARGLVTVPLTLEENGNTVSWTVYNGIGKQVVIPQAIRLGSGAQKILLNVATLGLAPGIYILDVAIAHNDYSTNVKSSQHFIIE